MSINEARMVTVPDARDMRFGEIFLVKPSGVDMYNTTGLNDCPVELWDALDLEEIRGEHDALQAQKNGPKYWMMDSQDLHLGETVSFGGIAMRWAARAPLSVVQAGGEAGAKPYNVLTPTKEQKVVYSAGKPVHELVDPGGHAYVMQAHGPEFTLDSLATLGDRLALPNGWQYRTRVLSEELVLDLGPDETIYAVMDDFRQVYTRI
jgi:hypothetical protein